MKEIIESLLQLVISCSVALFCKVLATIFLCDNIAPFGSPVVPEEYTKNARSSFGSIDTFLVFVLESITVEKCFILPSGSGSPMRKIRSRGNPAFKAASRATSRHDTWVARALAPEDLSNETNSPTVYILFMGQTTPPAQSVPKVTAAMSELFGVHKPITSPFCHVH